MAVFRLEVEYDGAGFAGFQLQPAERTVQGVLEAALADLVGTPHRMCAAGRTDAGCHARGQVVSVRCESRLGAEAMAGALNARLPGDVRIRGARIEGDEFDARRSARARRYAYRLLDEPSVLLGRRAWWPRRPVRGAGVEAAVAPLRGEHDFASFASAGSTPSTTRCRVHHARWSRWEGGWMLDIMADHFLYHMVRTIVGTALELQDRGDPAAAMADVVAARDRRRAGPTVPPQGLCLERVYYPGEPLGDGGPQG